MSGIRTPVEYCAIPLYCNTIPNKLGCCVRVQSDTRLCSVSLYEHAGVYWFCLKSDIDDIDINSVGFCSLRNCVSVMKKTMRTLGFVLLCSDDGLKSFVSDWEKGVIPKKGVA